MMQIPRRGSWLFAVVVMILWSSGSADGAANDELLEEIALKHTSNHQLVREVSIRFSTTVVDSSEIKSLSETRAARKGVRIISERTADPKYRSSFPEMRHTGCAYDGSQTRILDSTTQGRFYDGDMQTKFRNHDDLLGLQGYPAAGYDIIIPTLQKRVICDITESLRSGHFSVTATAEEVIANGPGQRLTFDRSRGFALLRRELFDGDASKPVQVHSISDLFEVIPMVWIGRRIDITMAGPANTQINAKLDLLEIQTENVADDSFVLTFPPKTIIQDYRLNQEPLPAQLPIVLPDGAIQGDLAPALQAGGPADDASSADQQNFLMYQAPNDPADLDKVVARAKKLSEVVQVGERQGASTRRWLLWANIAVLVIVALAFFARRVRR